MKLWLPQWCHMALPDEGTYTVGIICCVVSNGHDMLFDGMQWRTEDVGDL